MTTFNLSLEMDNAAFDDDAALELARILRELADRIEQDGLDSGEPIRLRDVNGNTVGQCEAVGLNDAQA